MTIVGKLVKPGKMKIAGKCPCSTCVPPPSPLPSATRSRGEKSSVCTMRRVIRILVQVSGWEMMIVKTSFPAHLAEKFILAARGPPQGSGLRASPRVE